MQTVKLSKEDGAALLAATRTLADAAGEENLHKKRRERSKEIIEGELKRLRGIELDGLEAHDLVICHVDGKEVLKLDARPAQRLDQAKLGAAHPDIVAQFTRPSVSVFFTSMLPKEA